MFEDLAGAVDAVLVLGSFETLHAGFDDVDGGVAVDGSGSGDGAEQSRHQLRHLLVLVASAIHVLEGEKDPKSDSLIRALLDDRRA